MATIIMGSIIMGILIVLKSVSETNAFWASNTFLSSDRTNVANVPTAT